MNKRNTMSRRQEIIRMVQEQGEVSVENLASLFKTSEVTIRKDLTALEESGFLVRRYGGAISIPTEASEELENCSTQKLAIAKAASKLIRDHNRIIIDSGRTTKSLVPFLNQRGLVVMTNSLALANELIDSESEPTVLMTGGTWDSRSESFQGQVAENALRSYDFDQLFIGADGIDLTQGTTTFNELVGLSRVMAEVSREVIVMIESQKIGRKMPNVELAWSQIDKLITDNALSEDIYSQIIALGIDVIIAE